MAMLNNQRVHYAFIILDLFTSSKCSTVINQDAIDKPLRTTPCPFPDDSEKHFGIRGRFRGSICTTGAPWSVQLFCRPRLRGQTQTARSSLVFREIIIKNAKNLRNPSPCEAILPSAATYVGDASWILSAPKEWIQNKDQNGRTTTKNEIE